MLKFGQRIKSIFGRVFERRHVDEAFLEELEATLLSADVGVPTTEYIVGLLKNACHSREGGNLVNLDAKLLVRRAMLEILSSSGPWSEPAAKPMVIMVVGVNGVGKTTTIAKVAARFKKEGRQAILVAADTFRAAAVEQLKIWGDRLGAAVICGQAAADPAAVAFDGVKAGIARGADVVIMDTSGRMHTKKNLMEELKKIARVVGRELQGAPHEKWLVIDASIGQNSLNQAKEFHSALGLTGAVVAKMDGTAKGGIVFAVARELGLPIRFVGLGEGIEDLEPFDAKAFVDAIL